MDNKRSHREDPDDSDGGNEIKKQKPLLENTKNSGTAQSDPKSSIFGDKSETKPAQDQEIVIPDEAALQRMREQQFEERTTRAYDVQCSKGIWDCALGMEMPSKDMQPMYIVSPDVGSTFMEAAFGADCGDERYSPLNGLVVNRSVKEALEAGALVIVPDLPNYPLPRHVERWRKSEPRQYKFRITQPEMTEYTRRGNGVSVVGRLDERLLEFKGDFRPRARFLHFLFHVTMLKRKTGITDDLWLAHLFRIHSGKFNTMYWGVRDPRALGRDPANVENFKTLLEGPNLGRGYESDGDDDGYDYRLFWQSSVDSPVDDSDSDGSIVYAERSLWLD
ncbi:uncharacterized protein F4807DRAFT_413172 [Annulohypoxylon truncatum]|uniref:uncharacterized protein n=1 Tax=Annulohypoxylon truncatum TaxID=327061 RepID=UPI0020076C11|nr:uncharacterized protein F4807DRAFT_413172 [Annulohypoxylon truncatum]KAI1213176.1 hypothetical protein F4807DRAFT_413172 [Annulohypoxylon truncatum]